MSEQFVKLNNWMAGMKLNPSETLIFAVIHSFSANGGSYYGGTQGLVKWTGCSQRTVQKALKRLVEEGWVLESKAPKGCKAKAYVSDPIRTAMLCAEAAPQETGADNKSSGARPLPRERRGTQTPRTARRRRNPRPLSAEEMMKICAGSEFYE